MAWNENIPEEETVERLSTPAFIKEISKWAEIDADSGEEVEKRLDKLLDFCGDQERIPTFNTFKVAFKCNNERLREIFENNAYFAACIEQAGARGELKDTLTKFFLINKSDYISDTKVEVNVDNRQQIIGEREAMALMESYADGQFE